MNSMKDSKKVAKSLFTGILLLFFNFSFAQSSSFTLDFVNGIGEPMGDFKNFAASGYNSGFVVHKKFCKNLAIGLNTSYAALPLKNNTAASNEKWSSFSMSIGPQYQIDIHKVFVQFYGQLGLSFINVPEVTEYYPKTDLITTDIKESNSSGLNTRVGINLGTEICKGLHLFVATEYSTNVNGDINAQTRDFSSAEDRSGQIDPDLASEIAFKKNVFSFSTLNINFGIRLDLNNATQKAQDHNASRSNTTSAVLEKPVGDDEDSESQKAQDHNASRSNTTSAVLEKPDSDTDKEDSDAAKVQDHNSTRSNAATR